MAHAIPQLPGVKHRFANAGGLKTHVALAGEGDPVVLLHGWPEHWYAWRRVIPRLAERHRVIAADLRGFGWTDIAWKGFEKESMAGDVARLLDALELPRARVIGHDWGGWIGFMLALRHPERVEQFVALSTLPPWVRLSLGNVLALRHLGYQVPLALPYAGKRLLERHPGYIRRAIRSKAADRSGFTKEDFRLYARDIRAPTRARASMLLHRTFLGRELVPSLAGRYRGERLTVPTLVMHGKRDPVVPPRLLAGLDRHAEDLRVEIVPDAGHYLPEERPELVADRAIEFFQGAERPVALAE
ncbi:MAG TPA: alpha/beta hydrolase [Thermoleophilaceae bacterium]|nr:alpha/beta hydrolase [Thermoleophilaceae bacterium]